MEHYDDRLRRLEEVAARIPINEVRIEGIVRRLDAHGKDIERLETIRPTTAELAQAMSGLADKIRHLNETIDANVKHLNDTIKPLRNGMYWFIALVMGSVLLAIMALILRTGQGAP